ncbi:MAG: RidA family protein [Pseudomonadota bacterium]|nr:RidA family protein [Pseudomonadota bacterium]
MRIRERLDKMGLELPEPFVYPSKNRTGCVVTRHLLYTSGHPPPENFGVKVRGKVGIDVTEEEAHAAARATALNILASVEDELGSLDRVTQVVKLTGMVNSALGFERQFAVIDGASDLLYELFGPQAGQHARSAVGMFELPRQFCMEIEAIFELDD